MASEEKYIRNVTLIGGSSPIGSYFLKHLLVTGKHTVTVLTRAPSTATIPPAPNLKVVITDYTHQETLVSALTGTNFLIITLTTPK